MSATSAWIIFLSLWGLTNYWWLPPARQRWLAADLRAEDRVVLKSAARMFGNVDAGALVVEEGAVIVGRMQIGPRNGEGQGSLL